jgi:hypothetical protein
MAGSRMIRKGFVDSDRVSALDSWFAECVFHRLLLVADDFGFYDARPAYLRAQLFSTKLDKVREADVSRALLECERAGLIRFYEVDGKRYLEVLRYGQRRDKTNPKWPVPEGFIRKVPGSSGKFREVPAIDGVGDGVICSEKVQESLTTVVSSGAGGLQARPADAGEVFDFMVNQPACLGADAAEARACAESFFNELEAVGWVNAKGVPVRDWRAMARSYLGKWWRNCQRQGAGVKPVVRRSEQKKDYGL